MENTETDLYEILFEKYEAHEEDNREKIIEVSISELTAFNNHPFRVIQDDELKKLTESIKDYGVLSPAIVRPKKDGGYELISGHRRKLACEYLGIDKLPALVREMTDEQAVIIMVDSNIQRENLLPSEKSFAYKMKLDALKHQGITSCQVGTKSRSDLELAEYPLNL